MVPQNLYLNTIKYHHLQLLSSVGIRIIIIDIRICIRKNQYSNTIFEYHLYNKRIKLYVHLTAYLWYYVVFNDKKFGSYLATKPGTKYVWDQARHLTSILVSRQNFSPLCQGNAVFSKKV